MADRGAGVDRPIGALDGFDGGHDGHPAASCRGLGRIASTVRAVAPSPSSWTTTQRLLGYCHGRTRQRNECVQTHPHTVGPVDRRPLRVRRDGVRQEHRRQQLRADLERHGGQRRHQRLGRRGQDLRPRRRRHPDRRHRSGPDRRRPRATTHGRRLGRRQLRRRRRQRQGRRRLRPRHAHRRPRRRPARRQRGAGPHRSAATATTRSTAAPAATTIFGGNGNDDINSDTGPDRIDARPRRRRHPPQQRPAERDQQHRLRRRQRHRLQQRAPMGRTTATCSRRSPTARP